MNKENKQAQTTRNNYKVKDTIKLAKAFQEDPHKDYRLKKNHCLVCHYTPGIAMQAFTHTKCENCQCEMTFPNSNVDKFCKSCCQSAQCCAKCGGAIEP